ncbi:hypothetical protein SAMN02910369_01501 [Lachnospiraceae bacterium NE2001]|nr:hypothetical protein SAMN02910369_01501 [Lachnospiraceae bacterium NE2001]
MLYKNKNIRSLYSFQIGLAITGAFFAAIGLILFIPEVSSSASPFSAPYSLGFILGGIFTIFGLILLAFNVGQLVMSRKIESLSGITANEIDKEASEETSIWFPILHIYMTENLIVGFSSDIGNLKFNQTAFRYNEIKKVTNQKVEPPNSEMLKDRPTYGVTNNGKYRIVVLAEDDKEYVLSEILLNGYVSENVKKEIDLLYEELKKKMNDKTGDGSLSCIYDSI